MCSQLGCGSAPEEGSSTSVQRLGPKCSFWNQIMKPRAGGRPHMTQFLCLPSDAPLACPTEGMRVNMALRTGYSVQHTGSSPRGDG